MERACEQHRSSFNSAIDGLLFEGNTLKQFMANVAKGIAQSFLAIGEKIVEDWIEQQIRILVTTRRPRRPKWRRSRRAARRKSDG